MGYGYFTFEELQWAEDGTLITDSTRDYKIPCVMDVPEKFNVTFLRNSRNLKAVYSSKVRKLFLMLFSIQMLMLILSVLSHTHLNA